jgi:hypothetical protein
MSMERLTKATDDLTFLCDHLRRETKFDAQRVKDIHDRLAAYEDIGLEPEYLTELVKICRNNQTTDLQETLKEIKSLGNLDRLRELAEADKDGRCVVLPCKVGQTIYKANKASRKVNPWVVNAIYFSSKTELIIEAGRGANHFTLGMFGRTVFLTRSEAEAALANNQQTNKQTISKLVSTKLNEEKK